ncbi:MAG: glycosyltransferase family 2 protein [Patescibacteria group bacterium]|jgi:glycosyltransferase involved in cell wall biosynthesis
MDKILSIIVPIYNEENLVAESLPAIFELPINKEIIIVNDGSDDRTPILLEKLKKQYDFTLIHQESNKGKGAAVKRGLEEMKGDYFIICDADLEYNPQEICKLFKEAKQSNNEKIVIYGSRFKNVNKISFHYLINAFLTGLTNLLFKTNLTDMETCFKLVPATALKKISLSGQRFEIEPEITARLLKADYKIIEFPISYSRRNYREGKKITAKDGILAVITLIKEKLA